jgi:ATP-dependent DNA helicase RecG
MADSILTRTVDRIKMVGPRRAAALKELKIITIQDLLYHFPRRYLDRAGLRPAGTCLHGEVVTLQGTVLSARNLRTRRGLTVTRVTVHDGLGIFEAVWFNQPYLKKSLTPGTKLFITGKVEKNFGVTQVVVEEYDLDNGGDSLNTGRLVPVYPLAGRLTQRQVRTLVKAALDAVGEQAADFLPEELLQKHALPPLGPALSAVHYPDCEDAAVAARKRFIFEELFLFQLALALRRRNLTRCKKAHAYLPNGSILSAFKSQLPFQLTSGQVKVWKEISRDLESPSPMNRLLQGDVGSGKTVIAAMALLKAVESGLQGALMAPTEILAEQHFLGIKEAFGRLDVEVALLTGSTGKKSREELLNGVRSGRLKVLVGTHALIQDNVEFQRLGLVVVDEQHRFGVHQRATLQHKSWRPDTLVMTATPIPRTLALTLYGDLQLSVIAELPPGRRPVKTFAVLPSALNKAYGLVREQVRQGRQAYIVCPLVEESEKVDLKAATELAETLASGEFREYRVRLLHGRMKAGQKELIMESFRCGETDILVATTVIEVGVDVPNATVMIVLDADRFGLSQLHQLRGRVGRSIHSSYCILIADPKTKEGRARLKAMVSTSDGFALAEEDLRLRGPGEFYGTRQSGLPEFKIADLVRDGKVLLAAREEALTRVQEDPQLRGSEGRLLLKEISARFGSAGSYIEVG